MSSAAVVRRKLSAYSIALIATAGAVAVRWYIHPWLGENLALVTVPAAVAAAVWFGGYRPALLATVLGYIACDYLFIPASAFEDVPSVVGLLAFLVSSLIIIGFGESLRTARKRTDEEQERLRTTLGSIGDGVITTDADGRIAYMNSVAASLTGWSLDDAAGQPLDAVFRIVNEHTRQGVENPATRSLREGAIVGLANHTILISKDGVERPIDDSAAPIRDKRGTIEGCALVFRDVSDRRRAELALQRSERELSDFFDNASVGLHWVGPDGTVLRVNQAELDLLGYSREEYVGRDIRQFHADDAVIEDILARLLRGDVLNKYPARMRCKDGSIKDVLINSNGFWEDGKFVHSRCFTLDITDRRRAEEARSLLAAIVAASDDAIVSKTLEGVVQSWNAAAERLFGYSAAEAIGQSINLIVPDERRAEEQEILERLRRGDHVDHFETVRMSKDGRPINVSLTISPIRDEAGRIVGASNVARDITERRRMEKELRAADRRKDEFLATLAHELRNPLAPILNSLETLPRAWNDRALAERAQATIERQVKHMVRLVDDLLDVSRITRDQLDLRIQRVELGTIIEQVVEALRPQAVDQQQTIEMMLPPARVYLAADPVRLAQIFSNLLNNACKYTPREGTIRLSARAEGAEAIIAVEDTGVGLPPEKLDSIFEMFEQGDPSLEGAQPGLGIGLTLAKRLVELHGGRIEARSEGWGRGSTFSVRLPVLEDSETVDEQPPAREEEPTVFPRRVLVVEDNRDGAESLAALLRLSGHDIEIVCDGLSALEAAAQFQPDVVLLDIGLPKLDGNEVCRRLRETPWGEKMLIIALTGWGQEEYRRQSQAAGFDEHLVKPVTHDQLMHLLAEFPAAGRS